MSDSLLVRAGVPQMETRGRLSVYSVACPDRGPARPGAASSGASASSASSPGAIHRLDADDVDEASEQMRDWRVELTQLERGRARISGLLVSLGNALVGRAQSTRALHVRGAAPGGSVSLLLNASRARLRAGDATLDGDTFAIYGGSAEVDNYAARDAAAVCVSIPRWKWLDMQRALHCDAGCADGRMLALSAPEDRLSAVVRLLCCICDAVESTSPMDARRTAALEVAVFAALASLIEARHAPQQAARERPGRFRAVMRAREFIHENLAERVSLPRLCDASRVSARTLEYGFREFFGVSPLAYVRFERLGQVHRELHGARRTEVSVTEAAMRWGFWHLGQFSRDYRSLFGECPSATLARARARRMFDAGRSAARSRRADRTSTVTGLPAG